MRIPMLFFLLQALAAASDLPPELLTVEGEARFAGMLARRVLLVTATERPLSLEDETLRRKRYGQAVVRGEDAKIVTSLRLTTDVDDIVVESLSGQSAKATVVNLDKDGGLAVLAALVQVEPSLPAPKEACLKGATLFFLAPGPGGLRLGRVEMGPDPGPPIEHLALVSGRLPLGAPLFDASGRLAALALWAVPGRDLTMITPMCKQEDGKDAGKVTP